MDEMYTTTVESKSLGAYFNDFIISKMGNISSEKFEEEK